jgi:hypothetical protein
MSFLYTAFGTKITFRGMFEGNGIDEETWKRKNFLWLLTEMDNVINVSKTITNFGYGRTEKIIYHEIFDFFFFLPRRIISERDVQLKL